LLEGASISDGVDRQRLEKREETLIAVTKLLEEEDTDTLLFEATQMLSQIFCKFVDRIGTDVNCTHFSVDLVSRCIAAKAHETLAAIIQLVSNEKSYSAMTLLRPMCEELIFLRYLKAIPKEDAEEYLYRRGDLEILQGLKAQQEFFPRAAQMFAFDDIPEFEFRSEVEELDSQISTQKKRLKELGKKVGWGNSPKPSAKYMAEETDNVPVYDFFYNRI
jgi:Family of unknown function (DUF5677)